MIPSATNTGSNTASDVKTVHPAKQLVKIKTKEKAKDEEKAKAKGKARQQQQTRRRSCHLHLPRRQSRQPPQLRSHHRVHVRVQSLLHAMCREEDHFWTQEQMCG